MVKKPTSIFIVLACLLALAICAVSAWTLLGVDVYIQAFFVLMMAIVSASFIVFLLLKFIYSKKLTDLSQSLVAISAKRDRHLFVPGSAAKILPVIEFHFDQILDENEQLFCEMQEVKTIYDSILNTQEELVFIIDKDGYISYRNKSFDELFGAPSLDFDKESSIFSENLSVLMQDISPLVFNNNLADRKKSHLSKISVQGEVRYIKWTINQVADIEPIKNLFVGRDETDELEARIKNEQMQKIATVGRAASTIFHEINQPLAIMQLSTFMMKNALYAVDGELSLAVKNDILNNASIVESQINRANQIVNNLRLFHSGGKKKLVFESIGVGELIKEALLVVDKDFEENRIELIAGVSLAEDVAIKGNKVLFVQVLVNILKNAIQALAASKSENGRRIIVSSQLSEGTVSVSIEDNGPGIAQNELPKATEPFYTTKEEGSGLGLALCLDILNSYQGRLNLKNRQPQGLQAIVSFQLPTNS